jgi:quercetin dioxygenase-like cupin family protein
MMMLRSRLEQGQLLPNVIELYGESEKRTHPGEETVYVLEGTLELTIGGTVYRLEKDEAATFWCSEEHSYAPVKGSSLPVRILSVTVQQSGRSR